MAARQDFLLSPPGGVLIVPPDLHLTPPDGHGLIRYVGGVDAPSQCSSTQSLPTVEEAHREPPPSRAESTRRAPSAAPR